LPAIFCDALKTREKYHSPSIKKKSEKEIERERIEKKERQIRSVGGAVIVYKNTEGRLC